MDYYVHEDDVKPTASTALDNWGATLHTLANVAPEIADEVNEIGGQLGAVYALAEQGENVEAMERISYSWGRVQEMATKAVMLDGGIQAAKEVVKVIEEERQRLDAEYAELERAVQEVDIRDERVDALVDDVREDLIDEVSDSVAYNQAQSMALDMYDTIRLRTGIDDWRAVNLLIDAIEWNRNWTDERIDLLTALVKSFQKEG